MKPTRYTPRRYGVPALGLLIWLAWFGGPALAQGESGQAPEPAAVSQAADPAEDRAIERRLRAIFANLEGLRGVRVQVRSGVVELSGEALSGEASRQAVNLARRVEGVVEVQNRISEVRDVQRRLTPAWQRLTDRARDLLAWLPLVGVAAAVMLAFWLLARLLAGWRGLYRRLTPNAFLSDLLAQVVRGAVLLSGLLLVLELLDATALFGTVLGAAGVIGLALGFALKDTVENYIASILLSLRQPFAPNDQVVIEGYEGRVAALTTRATTLITLEGNHVRIPNAKVFSAVIVNYTRNPERRFDFRVGVESGADLVRAQNLAVRVLRDMAGVLDDPPPRSWIEALGDSNVVLWVGGWVDQGRNDFARVRSEAIRLVKQAFEEADIAMPEPIYNLRWSPPDRTAPRPEPKGPAAVALDISRDTHLDRQVEADRARTGSGDLLNPTAPQE